MPEIKTLESRDQIITAALNARHERSFVIERAAAVDDEDTRTLELSFASTTPVTHFSWSQWAWIEIQLSMEPSAIRTERLESGAPLLADHNHRDQIGVIESFAIDTAGGKLRAKVRFSRSARGEEIYQDVLDGIRQNVSVGFMIHKLVLKEERDKKAGEIDLYEVTDWEPYECSIVAIPADISVGVGRQMPTDETLSKFSIGAIDTGSTFTNNSTTENNMSDKNELTPETPAVETPTRSAALNVAAEIREWGAALGAETIAETYLRESFAAGDEISVAAFKQALKASSPPTTQGPPPPPVADEAARQGARTELARSVYRGGPLRAFRGPDAEKLAHRTGMFLAASVFNRDWAKDYCRDHGIMFERTQTGTDNSLGGVLVVPEFEQSIIDLRIQYGVFRPNAEVIPMSSDTKNRNRRTGGLTAFPVGPGQDGTKSTATWDQVELVARKWKVLARYEEEVSEDAVINMADTLVDEAAYAMAFSEDNAGFNGDGSPSYHGIVGVIPKLTGLDGTVANIASLVVAAGNEWSEIVDADIHKTIGRLPQFARRSGRVKWYCSHTFKSEVLDKLAFAKGGVTYAETASGPVPMFMGYPVELVEVMPSVQANSQICLLFGNLSQAAIFGDRRGISVSQDVNIENDVHTIAVNERYDINVHSVGNASGTASERKAGPIVGLITAAS